MQEWCLAIPEKNFFPISGLLHEQLAETDQSNGDRIF